MSYLSDGVHTCPNCESVVWDGEDCLCIRRFEVTDEQIQEWNEANDYRNEGD